MEAILLLPALVAELLALCLAALLPAIVLGLELLSEFVALGLELVFGWSLHRSRKPETEPKKRCPLVNPIWRRRLRYTFLAVFAVATIGLLLVNFVFFESTLRFALGRVEASRGIKVTFNAASGNLFTGEFAVEGLRAVRQASETTKFDLRVEQATADVEMTSLLSPTKTVESLAVSGIRGRIDRIGKKTRPHRRVKKRFEVNDLSVKDVQVEFLNRVTARKLSAGVTVYSLSGRPVRSRLLVFDILFRSNVTGRIGGRPFLVEAMDSQQMTSWKVDHLPVAILATFVGGPLVWLTDGQVDIDVRSTWLRDTGGDIALHWKTVFENLKAEVPSDASLKTRLFWTPVVAYMNQRSRRMPLEFDVKFGEGAFSYTMSAQGRHWLNRVAEALIKEIAVAVGVPVNKVRDATAQEASDRAKNKIRQLRDKLLKPLKKE